MRRALELAVLGNGQVAPNPMVGAVIVYKNEIVGEGYHQSFGEAHAEVNAINAVKDQSILSESTIYVSLEPCAHHGKTPPCADLIIQKKLKRVVVGCGDSFEAVNGKGIQRIKNAGIEVTAFVLERESRALNKKFFTMQEKKRPFVLLKWAETPNGFIDSHLGSQGEITWISKPETQPFVHQLRVENEAILVGKNTVINDNPSLTVRAVSGRQPLRVILDTNCEIAVSSKVLTDGSPTLILNTKKSEKIGPVEYSKIDSMSPYSILNELYVRKIQSVLVEGGTATLQSFIDSDLWDEIVQIKGEHNFDSGTEAPSFHGKLLEEVDIFGDIIKRYHP